MRTLIIVLLLVTSLLAPTSAHAADWDWGDANAASACSADNVIYTNAVHGPIQFVNGYTGRGFIYAPYGWCYDPAAPVSWVVRMAWY